MIGCIMDEAGTALFVLLYCLIENFCLVDDRIYVV